MGEVCVFGLDVLLAEEGWELGEERLSGEGSESEFCAW